MRLMTISYHGKNKWRFHLNTYERMMSSHVHIYVQKWVQELLSSQDLNMKFSILRLSGMSVLQFLLDNRNIVEILWEKKWSKLQVRNNINNTSPSCFNSHTFFHLKQAKQRYTSKKISITFPPQQTLQQTHWWSQDFRPNVGFTWPTFATKTPSSRAWRGSLRGSPACHVPPAVGVFYWWEGTPLYHQKMLEGCGIMWIANKETQIYTDKNDMTILDMRTHPIFLLLICHDRENSIWISVCLSEATTHPIGFQALTAHLSSEL